MKTQLVVIFMFCLLAFSAVLAPSLPLKNPNSMKLSEQFTGPTISHPMGQDENGSDVLAKVIWGARTSLSIAIIVTLINLLVGMIMGSLAGYNGGTTDSLIMRSVDLLSAFPHFILALAILALLDARVSNLIFALCLTGWTSYARLVRSQVIALHQKEFVQACRALGGTSLRQVMQHIWPNLMGPLIVHSTFSIAGVIISESGLSFLGLGVPADTPSWGSLLSSGRRFLLEAPQISLFPGFAIVLSVLTAYILGESLRKKFFPAKSY